MIFATSGSFAAPIYLGLVMPLGLCINAAREGRNELGFGVQHLQCSYCNRLGYGFD